MARIKERRRRQRVDVALPIKIAYNGQIITAVTKNISTLGTYIEINKTVPIGKHLKITIKIPEKETGQAASGKQISCQGTVFRSQPTGSLKPKNQYGIGIFFRSFSAGVEKQLSDYIDLQLLKEQETGRIYMLKRKRK